MKAVVEKVNKYQVKEEDLKFIPYDTTTRAIGKVGIIISNYTDKELKCEKEDVYGNQKFFVYIDNHIMISLKEICFKLENDYKDYLNNDYNDYFIRISIFNDNCSWFSKVEFKDIKFKINRDFLGSNEIIEVGENIDLSFKGHTPIIINS